MLQSRGTSIYRHRLDPAVLTQMKNIQEKLALNTGLMPSQSVLLSRAIGVYSEHLATAHWPEEKRCLLLAAEKEEQ